ncbi:hypothetical protein QQS21_012068 [Conoideocrella luteorostrata]|uniref:Uncharacterized protein n=1 Tax=Conoideocrella luteorostrata TaxID=1105319 RepID=A0AAJ0CCY7_9HYPO|nr:hypothetical protein QQS21_012068 [Conoideocrella luteorostrata]
MTSLDGEYMLLGRKSEDTSNIFVQYGQGSTRTVNVTGGSDFVQEAEFIDGLRLRIKSSSSFGLNIDIPFGIDARGIPEKTESLNSYTWAINTTAVDKNNLSVDMTVPVNHNMLAKKLQKHETEKEKGTVLLARRELAANSTGCFRPVENQQYIKSQRMIKVERLTSVDGQYVVLVSKKKYHERPCPQKGEEQERCSAKEKSAKKEWLGGSRPGHAKSNDKFIKRMAS